MRFLHQTWLLICSLGALTACSIPSAPPLIGFSKFAHSASLDTEQPQLGKISATAGGLIDVVPGANGGGEGTAFHAEGALSAWLAPWYDLTVGAGPFMLGVEGNVVPLHNSTVRLGLIHGVGGAIMGNWSNSSTSGSGGTAIFFDFSAGPFFQVNVSKAASVFLGAKYTFATYAEVKGNSCTNNTHYLGFSVGAPITVVRSLSIAPEMVVTYYGYNNSNASCGASANGAWADAWLLTPMVTASAAF